MTPTKNKDDMNIIDKIAAWVESRRRHTIARRRALCDEHAKDTVQVREFNSVVYLSYNDTPLVPVDDFKKPVADILDAARKAYSDYMMTKF